MARSVVRAGILASLITLPHSVAYGLTAPQQHHGKSLTDVHPEFVLRPEMRPGNLKNRRLAGATVMFDKISGTPRLISGELTEAITERDAESFIRISMDWLAANSDVIGLSTDNLAVLTDATLITQDVQFISFKVKSEGLDVKDAAIQMRFKQGVLVQVLNDSHGTALVDHRMDSGDARKVMEEMPGISKVASKGEAIRIVPTSKGYQQVRVAMADAEINGEPVSIQTEVATGRIFEIKSTRHYASGRAHGGVFTRTYYKSTPVDANLSEIHAKVGTSTVRANVGGIFTAASEPKVSGLTGTRINVNPKTGTPFVAIGKLANNEWDLAVDTTAEKDQAQVNVYHHLNLVIQRAKNYINTPWMDQNLTANVNLSDTCNAYWDGTTVNFFSAGGGCGNTGLIADVSQHEWGHGLDDNTGGIDDGAYSEGFGDIMSIIMNRDSKLGPGFKSTGAIVRDTEPDKVYPKDQGEVHQEGLIIGGTIWDLYKGLTTKYNADKANDLVAAIAFKTIFTAKKYTDVYNAALVVNDNDTSLENGTPDLCEINDAFTRHGLSTKDARCP